MSTENRSTGSSETLKGLPPVRIPKLDGFCAREIGHSNRDINLAITTAMTTHERGTETYKRMLEDRLKVCEKAVNEVISVTERPKFEMPKRRKLLEVQIAMQKALDEMGIDELDGGCKIILVGLFPYNRQGKGTGGGLNTNS